MIKEFREWRRRAPRYTEFEYVGNVVIDTTLIMESFQVDSIETNIVLLLMIGSEQPVYIEVNKHELYD